MVDIKFLENIKTEMINDLAHFDADSIPQKSGVYILMAKGTTM